MSQTYISVELRRQVILRASSCCEYCRLSSEDSLFSFQIDHIIPEKHDGETIFSNLALSCASCNGFKGSEIASYDKDSGLLTPLYNPRIQIWDEHFQLDGAIIKTISSIGRVTVKILKLNRDEHIKERIGLMRLGRYPCNKK